MPGIVWSNRYTVKVEDLDEQHRRMAELVNTANDRIKAEDDREAVIEAFTDLIGYTASHFATEEALMKKYKYPDYKKHKEEHKDLVNLLRDIERQFKRGSESFSDFDYDLAKDWLVIHTDWLTVHLTHSDRDLGSFLNKQGRK